MNSTENLGLTLFESDDKFRISQETQSLNKNMKVLDEEIPKKAKTDIIAQKFNPENANGAGSYVVYEGELYILPAGHEANVTWENTSKTKIMLADEVAKKYEKPVNGIPAADLATGVIPDVSGKANLSVIAPAFAEATVNVAGSLVTYTDGVIYLLPEGHEAGITWGNTVKTATNIAAELTHVKSDLTSMESELHGVLVEGEEGETVTVINVDNAYNLYDLGFRDGFNRAYADGVVTYTVDGTNATPQVNYQNARGDKKWVIGFKYKISKIDPAFDDDGTIRIYLGTTQYNESIVWGEWINFEKTVTLDLTRIYLILRSFASTPASNSIKLEVKELYVYDGTNISTEMCEYIHQEQRTNYQDGTVTYGEVTEVYVPDDTLTQSKKAADAKATGDAINEVSEVINGELVDSINLFNKSDPDIISGGYIDKTGVQQTLANYNESGFIPCEHGDTLTLTKSGAYFTGSRDIVFYDENKQFVSGDTGIMPTITVSGSSKKYIRFPIKNDELDVTMIVKNDTAIHDYIPYGKIPTGGLTERVTNLDRPWEGKNVVLLGDSITYNDGHNGLHGYPYYLEPIGFSTITNKGVNGACVAYHEGRQYESICTTVDSVNFASYDLVTIAGGINDYNTSSATPIGSLVNSVTLTDFDKTTFIGALQYIITKILTSNAKIKIALFTPLKKTNWYDTNSESKVLKDYADAIKEVAEYYSIPVLDFYSISGFNRMNLSEYTSDGLHPNNDGYKFICKNKLVDFIRGL